MKKSLKAMIASATLLLATSVLAGCGNKEPMIPVASVHEHTFSENWEASDSSHWHKATCEHTDVMSGVEDHKFGTWDRRTEPTETEEGVQYRTCTVCNYEQTAAIARLDHQHVFSQAWEADDDNHWHKATCHTNVYSNFEAHTYGNWSVKVAPTETTKGLKERVCSVCNHKETAEVDMTLHVHTYASEWSTSKEAHWHAATCEHASEGVRKDYEVHAFTNWIVDEASTETVKGFKYRTCEVCGYREEEELPLADHVHTFANEYSSNEVEHWYAATCGHNNVRDAVEAHTWGAWNTEAQSTETVHGRRWRKCIECDYIQNEELPLANHVHTYSNEWSKNATEHWKAATCGHDDSRKDVGEHSFGAWTVDNASTCCNQGTKHRVCSVCGYVENAAAELNNDAHSFANTWTYDENTHWHAATCGHAVKGSEAAHNMRSSASYPTWNDPRMCTTCGYIAQPAGKNTTQGIPFGYVTIEQFSRVYFTFTLQSASQIKLDFIMEDKANCQALLYVYDAQGNNAGISGAWLRNAPFNSTRTVPAGQYFILISNNQTNCTEFDVLIHNFTYVYDKAEVESMDITADEVTANYTMYKYTPKYGVSQDIAYYSIENEAGDELQVFTDGKSMQTPNFYQNGIVSYRNKSGSTIYTYTPRFIYRSPEINQSPYTILERNEEGVKLGVSMANFLKAIKTDTGGFAKIQNSTYKSYTSLNANLVAWFCSKIADFTPSYWTYKDGNYSCRYNYYPFFAADDNEYDLDANTAEMSYIAEDGIFYAKNPAYGYNGVKLVNTTNASFSRFYYYSNATEYGNDSRRNTYASSTFILDENGYDIRFNYLAQAMNTNFTVDSYAYLYDRSDSNTIFEIQPGETYYIFENCNSGADCRFVVDQTRYSFNINANYGDDPEIFTYADKTLANGAHYEQEFRAKNFDPAFRNAVEEPDGKTLIGYSETPDGEVQYLKDAYSSSYSTVKFTAKQDTTIYAKWMDKTDVITTYTNVSDYIYDDTYDEMIYEFKELIDLDLTVKAGDAVNFVYAGGTVLEYMIKEVGYDGNQTARLSAEDSANHDGELPYMIISMDDDTDIHELDGSLVAIKMKQKFAVSYTDNNGVVNDLAVVDKGLPTVMPRADELGMDIYTTDKFFIGWSDSNNDVVATLDGGLYNPVKDTVLTPVYKDKAGSNVVALQYGMEFVEIGGVEYLKLEVLDPSLTITTATHFIVMFNNGSTEEIGVTQILNINGVNLPSGATSASGEILLNVFNLQAKKDMILHANLILADNS